MPLLADPFSSRPRPVLKGVLGAVSAADPLAVSAGTEVLVAGGNAVDATIAAQAVVCVTSPNACGLGGDALMIVKPAGAPATALNGTGAAPSGLAQWANDGANSVTVPGLVHAWGEMHARFGSLPLARLLEPAIRIARQGFALPPRLAASVKQQRARLVRGGAEGWSLLGLSAGDAFVQPGIAALLEAIGRDGAPAYYEGRTAAAIAGAIQRLGGAMTEADMRRHETPVLPPLAVDWRGLRVDVQPPITQGVILAMALNAIGKLGEIPPEQIEHAAIELTQAAFGYRDRCAEGAALLDEPLEIDLTKASNRGGPRAYLHTAGIAASDRSGLVVSSLISVFDDFGSAVFVPEGGFVLNDRGAGFTAAPNDPAPGKRPVHTLAPALVEMPEGALAMSTPGADGQVQTLLQILLRAFVRGDDLATAIDAPRWRSEGGKLLIERGHPEVERLAALGHDLAPLADGDIRFGGIVAAGFVDGVPIATADWRRQNWAGAV